MESVFEFFVEAIFEGIKKKVSPKIGALVFGKSYACETAGTFQNFFVHTLSVITIILATISAGYIVFVV